MIDDYRGLAIFVAVADAGGFSAAGRRLKLSTSVVSHHVSKLEAKLGVPLFFRSTRSLALTGEGRQILDAARRMVAAGAEALDALSRDGGQPSGALRLSMPAFGSATDLHRAVWAFARAHPLVALTLHSSDRPVDLVAEGYDLAIRLGVLADSALKSRRIGVFRRRLVAAPGLLSGRAAIVRPADLVAVPFVSMSMLPDAITLVRGSEEVTVTPDRRGVEVDAVHAAKAAVLAGLGIRHLPSSEVAPELASGALVEVLPGWHLPDLGVYAVWPDSGPRKNLTRRLIDHLAARDGPGDAR